MPVILTAKTAVFWRLTVYSTSSTSPALMKKNWEHPVEIFLGKGKLFHLHLESEKVLLAGLRTNMPQPLLDFWINWTGIFSQLSTLFLSSLAVLNGKLLHIMSQPLVQPSVRTAFFDLILAAGACSSFEWAACPMHAQAYRCHMRSFCTYALRSLHFFRICGWGLYRFEWNWKRPIWAGLCQNAGFQAQNWVSAIGHWADSERKSFLSNQLSTYKLKF